MDRKTADQYGAGLSLTDAEPVEDPTTQWSAEYIKRLAEDVAQLTRTAPRAILIWTTKGSGAVGTAVRTKTMWGDTLAFAPAIARSGTGVYALTYPATLNDGLVYAETIAWFSGHTEIGDNSRNKAITIVTGAVANVTLWDSAGAASDFTPDVTEIATYLY